MNYDLIDNIEFGDVHGWDANRFTDAFILSADYDGVPMTEEEIEDLDPDWVHEQLLNQLY